MSSRRPLQPIPALSANVASTRSTRITTSSKAAHGHAAGGVDMDDHVQDDAHDSGSVVSGLTSLSGDDEFERLMIQNARDERRLNEARNGRVQPFRKARTHARVGLTMDNLERSDAQHHGRAPPAHARGAIKSPPSSSGSTRSDPAIHAPASWGRKGRSSRNWMRSITRDERPQQTPAPPDEPGQQQQQHDGHGDSPLSHKSGGHATPRHDDSGDFDLTFDMPDASILASTPYIPRNTKLDDIREREMESLREGSPEETRRPRSSAGPAAGTRDAVDTAVQSQEQVRAGQAQEQVRAGQAQEQGSPIRRLRKRTDSWLSLSKSVPELSQENAPIAVHRKSAETVGTIARDVVASADRQPTRPLGSRRTDSQHLLRRLARASNTPSPKAVVPAARPQTAPPTQPHSSSQTAVDDAPYASLVETARVVRETIVQERVTEATSTTCEDPPREKRHDTPHDGTTPEVPSSAPPADDVDATPLPTEQTTLHPKTPLVMGGWIDTPGPRTTHRPLEPPRPRSPSPRRSTSRKPRSPERPTAPAEDRQPEVEAPEPARPSLPRPQLPSSALDALVQEARASHDYGEDTIHSLEDLITPLADNEAEEDTLQGLALPTSAPRNEAERERHAETVQIHRLNRHLRATTTNIRDVSRGIRRMETRIGHIDVEETGEKVPVIVRHLEHKFSPWIWFRSFFWDERLKTQREIQNAALHKFGGVTLLGILLTVSFIWWASETVACEMFCHPEFARYSPHPFAVNMDAPKRGVVIPTLAYRALFKSWSMPILSPVVSLFSWVWATLWSFTSAASITGVGRASHNMAPIGGPAMAAHTQASWKIQEEAREEDSWEWSMAEDEILRR